MPSVILNVIYAAWLELFCRWSVIVLNVVMLGVVYAECHIFLIVMQCYCSEYYAECHFYA